MYNILVNGEIIAENVLKSDVQHKIRIIQEYYKIEKDPENPAIAVVLNKPETIA